MTAGYSGTPLTRKLGIEEGHRVATLNAPDHLGSLLGDLPPGVRLDAGPPHPAGAAPSDARSRDVVLLFAPDAHTLRRDLDRARALVDWAGGLWIAWPKRASSIETDLDREEVRRVGLETGLVDNKVCAVDEDWSALRFVHRLEDRPE